MAATTDRRLDAPAEGPGPDDIEPVLHETRDRIITGTVTVVPSCCSGSSAGSCGTTCSTGTTSSCSRSCTSLTGPRHHGRLPPPASPTAASRRRRPLRGVFAALGSMAIEGPVISWVADHRKHHAFSDQPGDPHSPHVDHGGGWRGALRGLAHAHVGWLFIHTAARRKPPLRARPDRRPGRVASSTARSSSGRSAGCSVPFGLGSLIGGTLSTGADRDALGRRGADARPAPRRPTRSTRCATSSGAARSRPTTSRATSRGWRRSRSARRGTTTTTRSRPRPRTACGAGRSTSRPG